MTRRADHLADRLLPGSGLDGRRPPGQDRQPGGRADRRAYPEIGYLSANKTPTIRRWVKSAKVQLRFTLLNAS
jgi:hypothetical protein